MLLPRASSQTCLIVVCPRLIRADCPTGYVSTSTQLTINPTVFSDWKSVGGATFTSSRVELVVGTASGKYAQATATNIWYPPVKLTAAMNVPKGIMGSLLMLDANDEDACPLLRLLYAPSSDAVKGGRIAIQAQTHDYTCPTAAKWDSFYVKPTIKDECQGTNDNFADGQLQGSAICWYRASLAAYSFDCTHEGCCTQ